MRKTWLVQAPPTEPFGLGCRLCKSYAEHNPQDVVAVDSAYINVTKGQPSRPGGKVPILQLEDLLRHAGSSRKSKARSKFHERAVQFHLGGPVSAAVSSETTGKDALVQPLSWKQLLISMQVCHSPVGSQGSEYERRCKDAHRTSPLLCPLSRTSRSCHYQIQESLAEVLFARDRAQLLGKNGVLSMSLAQD